MLLSSVLPHFPSSPTALLGELQMKLSTRPHSHRQSVKDRHTPQTAGDHLSPKKQNYSVCFLSPHPRGRGETNNTTMKQHPKADLGNSQLYRTAKLLELAPLAPHRVPRRISCFSVSKEIATLAYLFSSPMSCTLQSLLPSKPSPGVKYLTNL